MGRRSWRDSQAERERELRKRLKPSWVIVGCLMPLVLGTAAYLLSGWFLAANAEKNWIYFPAGLMNPPFAPHLRPGLLMRVGLSFLFMLAMYVIVYALYALFFPVKPGETDSPPLKPRRLRKP
ncbi:MAG: hypothetical protein PVJ07_01450 [Anaerolineales bacterium]|jgi:hypothetical protein